MGCLELIAVVRCVIGHCNNWLAGSIMLGYNIDVWGAVEVVCLYLLKWLISFFKGYKRYFP